MLNPQSPKRIDAKLRAILNYLSLNEDSAVHLKFSRPRGFTPALRHCHFNVWCQIRISGGSPQSGWVLAQDRAADFSEAIFHTVWRDPFGKLVDVTPRGDLEKRLLFVPDPRRSIELLDADGRPAVATFENVRVYKGEMMTPLRRLEVVMEDDFAQKNGLWPW